MLIALVAYLIRVIVSFVAEAPLPQQSVEPPFSVPSFLFDLLAV